MADQGNSSPFDSDAPTLPGVGHDQSPRAGVGADTPPPSSFAVTSAEGIGASPAPISDSVLRLAQLFPPGSVLGSRYEILRVLGEGGMGAVYQARDKELDRLIALKVIRPELAGNPAILQRWGKVMRAWDVYLCRKYRSLPL